jgi:hypothetical protein
VDVRELRGQQHGRRGALPRLRDLALHHPALHGRDPDEPASLTGSPLAAGTRARHDRDLSVIAIVAFAVLAALAAGRPPVSRGADPTAAPDATARPATCAERFPEEGPAGVDLRLGCTVGEVVGVYTAANPGRPAPLSTYAILVGIVIAGGLGLAWLVGRFFARRAGRRLAPVLPSTWWVCASCSSVNGAGVQRCYSCGTPQPDGPMLSTADDPGIPQSFGRTRKSG